MLSTRQTEFHLLILFLFFSFQEGYTNHFDKTEVQIQFNYVRSAQSAIKHSNTIQLCSISTKCHQTFKVNSTMFDQHKVPSNIQIFFFFSVNESLRYNFNFFFFFLQRRLYNFFFFNIYIYIFFQLNNFF